MCETEEIFPHSRVDVIMNYRRKEGEGKGNGEFFWILRILEMLSNPGPRVVNSFIQSVSQFLAPSFLSFLLIALIVSNAALRAFSAPRYARRSSIV